MPIQPISNVGGAAVPLVPSVDSNHLTDPSSTQVALAEAHAKESQTLEQRAGDGDTIALTQLAIDETQMTPIDSQQLLPPTSQHPPGADEPGKGILIDVYD